MDNPEKENVSTIYQQRKEHFEGLLAVDRNYGRLAHKLTPLQVNSPTPKLTRLQDRG